MMAAVVLEHDIVEHQFDSNYMDVALIFLSCLIAVVLNITSFGKIMVQKFPFR
jgi:hypothetical protein